jgi:hypothetical protein
MPWWGGHSFGSRIIDLLPFLTYFLAFPLQWCLSAYSPQHTVVAVCIAGLAAVSIFIHAQGALRFAPHQWNADPTSTPTLPVFGIGMIFNLHDVKTKARSP